MPEFGLRTWRARPRARDLVRCCFAIEFSAPYDDGRTRTQTTDADVYAVVYIRGAGKIKTSRHESDSKECDGESLRVET